jgi:uncharacterized protein YecA (UPF0149 family)
MRPTLRMTDEEFAEFRQHLVLPMIQRHREMFPGMHGRSERTRAMTDVVSTQQAETYPGTARNAPCQCGSGRKYKRCCGPRR